MKLFKLNTKTYEVEFEESVLLLAPFSALFKRDKSKHKELAIKELAYIWFFADITSDYQIIFDENERKEELIKDLKLSNSWVADSLIDEAISFYRERSLTISSKLVEDSYAAVSKISEYLRDVNLNETEIIRGQVKPKHDVKKIADTIKVIPQLLEALRAADKAYLREKQDNEGKSKGSKSFNTFEDGLSF